MKTRCRRCRKLIEFGETYCDTCYSKILKHKKQNSRNELMEKTSKSSRWQKLRADIIRRDKCCINCFESGIIEYKQLQVHHIVKRVEDESLIYDPENLITLCKPCHDKIENISVVKQKEMFKKYTGKDISYRLL